MKVAFAIPKSLIMGVAVAAMLLAPAHAETPQSPEEAPAATRELRIAELPFLVTEEPVFEAVGPAAEERDDRPQLTRATINPFSPIIGPAPAEALVPEPLTPTLPPPPEAPAVLPAAPPDPVVPPTPAARLPLALPGVTRPALPPPLTSPRPVSALRRYLHDHQVVFTAAVLGPVGVGIFRTTQGTAVVALGETLPGSDLVLSGLDGQRAEFTRLGGDESVTLTAGRQP